MQIVRPVHALLASLLAVLLVPLALTDPASAATPTVTTLSAPSRFADTSTPLTTTVATADATPVPDAAVVVERRVGGTWQPFGTATTDANGRASLPATLSRVAADNVFRASYAGDPTYDPSGSGPVAIKLVRRQSRLVMSGPHEVVDEKSVTLRLSWRTGNDLPIAGPVRVYRREGTKWVLNRTVRTAADGRASFTITPRADSRWMARGVWLDWVEGDATESFFVDNLPPGVPVRLPSAAPKPRIALPKQPHGVGAGANPRITTIPDRVWNQMTGITWHRGCPVGRSGLRYLTINYWDYQGYRRRGEMVIATGAAGRVRDAFVEMYAKKLPIRAMYRVDRFGWSSRLNGGNDYKSMAAGNTSGFNCRSVVNRPGVRSPHAWGRAIDVNTWENPYRSATGLVPNTWWMSRSHKRVAWRSRSHAVVQVMARHGMKWTYGLGDTQHFDAASGSGRVVMAPGCVLPAAYVCD